MSDKDKLNSCPFCGADEAMLATEAGDWYVDCDNCFARGPSFDSESEAAMAWDLRSSNGAYDKLLAACKDAFLDLRQYEWVDLPDGYAVKATVDKLRAAIKKAEGET